MILVLYRFTQRTTSKATTYHEAADHYVSLILTSIRSLSYVIPFDLLLLGAEDIYTYICCDNSNLNNRSYSQYISFTMTILAQFSYYLSNNVTSRNAIGFI